MTYQRILMLLVAFVAVAGVASAQCPECDEDGDGVWDNTYHDIDVGAVVNDTEALVDTDFAHSHNNDDSGLWAWLSLCLHAVVGPLEKLLGVDLGIDGNVEAYVSEEGVDLDATLYAGEETVDFDDSELGDLDGMTWQVMAEVNAAREQLPVDEPRPEIPDYEGLDVDVCVTAELHIVDC